MRALRRSPWGRMFYRVCIGATSSKMERHAGQQQEIIVGHNHGRYVPLPHISSRAIKLLQDTSGPPFSGGPLNCRMGFDKTHSRPSTCDKLDSAPRNLAHVIVIDARGEKWSGFQVRAAGGSKVRECAQDISRSGEEQYLNSNLSADPINIPNVFAIAFCTTYHP